MIRYSKQSKTPSAGLKYSILIPTWNNLRMLQCCIASIRKNSTFKHQIIVHINEGADGTLEWVQAQPDVDYCYTPANVGVCYALNLARTLAATDYIVFLNDDMYVCPQWDAAFAGTIEAIEDNLFFLSGTLIEPKHYLDGGVEKDYGNTPDTFREQDLLANYSALAQPERLGALYPPNIVHKDIWDLVGGYSIEFSPGMGSDPDFVAKLWKVGVRHFRIVGDCLVYHFGKATTSRIRHNKAKATFVLKWGHTFRTVKDLVTRYGMPATPKNIALPCRIPATKTLANRLKRLRYAILYLFNNSQKL